MINTWLKAQIRKGGYSFSVIDITEEVVITDDILNALAKQLITASSSPVMIKRECRKLIEDSSRLKLDVIREYVEKEVLPNANRISTRVGNFGEILAAIILIEFEQFWLPIYKLRFREKKDWSMRLTDLCLIKKHTSIKPLVCFGEVKTKSSACDTQIGIKGHDSLAKDNALEDPGGLHFLCTHLYEMGKYDEADFLSDIRLGRIAYDFRHDLFIIHNKEDWQEKILENLNNHDLDKRLVDFSVKVVLISQLREVIDQVYERAWRAAEEVIDE
jgi:hypothetical protein